MGKAFCYGDHVDTDVIIPARYLTTDDAATLSAHAMEDLDPAFAGSVALGDVVFAGDNFGCGSSREHAPIALKAAGVSAVVARSFARIFFRNAINTGLPVLVCPEAVDATGAGDEIEIYAASGTVRNMTTDAVFTAEELPPSIVQIVEAGGLVPWVSNKLRAASWKPRVAVVPGDGIGPEVIASALARYGDRFEVTTVDAGAERYLATGELLTPADLATISESDALLFGAIGDPRVPDGVLERGILLRLRTELDLYVNLRPFPELGIALVRENTEGLYAGYGWSAPDSAAEINVNTASAITRCVRYAFDLAESRSKRVTWVHKTNVLTHSGGLWRKLVRAVAEEHPNVDVSYEHVDAAAYHLVTNKSRFDVVVTDNLFGDILSDLAAGVTGGLGLAAGANLHPDPSTRPTRCVGLFEPIHGSAPDIAGTGTADPTGAIRACEMLLDALQPEEATSV